MKGPNTAHLGKLEDGLAQFFQVIMERDFISCCPTTYALFLFTDIGYVGGVPFSILEPVLKKATARQLLTIEDYNCVRIYHLHVYLTYLYDLC